jgi:tripartite-type tricarboxylate transporter receptor subunit TctC
MKFRSLGLVGAALAVIAFSSQVFCSQVFCSQALAQSFPTKQIRLMIPYPPGGGDIMARMLQESMITALGQPVVIENKPGAAGVIASREIAHASPDGYALLFTNVGPMAVAPIMQPGAGYDPVTSFAPVSLVSRQPLVLVVHPSVAANSLQELIQLAKEKPGAIKYSSAGLGSFGHLSTELFALAADVKMTHVAYKGVAPAITAVLSGEVSMALTVPTGTMNEYIKQGKLRLLGVSTLEPSPLAPGATPISTVLPRFGAAEYWFGVVAPAKTPPAVVATLNAAIVAALAKPGLKEKFVDLGALAESSTPEAFSALVSTEAQRWRDTIEKNNIRLN